MLHLFQGPQGGDAVVRASQVRATVDRLQISTHGLESQAVAQGQILLLSVDSKQAERNHDGVNHRALPGGEHIDIAEGEATQTRLGRSAAEQHRLGKQGVEASTGKSQADLDLREHRGEISPLGQSITPATLQRFDDGCCDPGFIGQVP